LKIKILFDKESRDRSLRTGWGVSFLVNDTILFDTGERGKWLIENMKNLSVDITKIKAVVISHDHWDHRNGLWALLQKNHRIKVYACPHFAKRFKKRIQSCGGQLVESDPFALVGNDVYTTGEIAGTYHFKDMPEQALVLKTQNGLAILTGCAHPGIVKIIEHVKNNIPGKIFLVIGGFHLIGKHAKAIKGIIRNFRENGIEKVGPTHCTGKSAIGLFEKEYKGNFIGIKVGETIEI